LGPADGAGAGGEDAACGVGTVAPEGFPEVGATPGVATRLLAAVAVAVPLLVSARPVVAGA